MLRILLLNSFFLRKQQTMVFPEKYLSTRMMTKRWLKRNKTKHRLLLDLSCDTSCLEFAMLLKLTHSIPENDRNKFQYVIIVNIEYRIRNNSQ